MSPTRRGFLTMLGGVSAGAALAGCGPGSPGRDSPLRVLAANHVWTRAVRERIGEFEELVRRRVTITMLTGDQLASAYNVKLNASATDIDVLMVRALQEQALFTRNGWLADLTDLVTGDAGYRWSDVQQAPRTASIVDGRVRSVPVVTERPVLYYRKDLTGAPGTLAELLDRALRLHDPGRGMFGAVGRGQRTGAVTQWSSFLYSHGGDFVVDGRSAIASPAAINAYQYYGELLGRAGPPGVANMSLEQAMPVFAQGKAAFYVDADAIYTSIVDPKTSLVRDRVGFAPFPAGPAGARPYNVPSWSLGINRFSLLQEDSWRFLRWASSPAMVAALQAKGIPGARESVWADAGTLTGFPAELAAAMQVNARNGIGSDRPRVLQVGRARDIVGAPLVAGVLGQPVEPAARAADVELAAFLVRDNRHREHR
ncbi:MULTISPECIES: ABC transporter substrate-binding protein [unclassified Crossiella]|uniref:ABC transporter substrate-binding protein n=1 Tax=unclassified Crossiella TaxID=2620835 RepID=UPI001FFF3BC0|nr:MULTISPECIES: extracellular solute-binding protein [unclassified Crossiella]MCK2244470.1 extracellular solute-binding protein [Crossiella sp. S99.2]MCK2258101.1 extracellular solute-binding protein [Crossiella sp. S99.1]